MRLERWVGCAGIAWLAVTGGLKAAEPVASAGIPTELGEYVGKADDSYSWKIEEKQDLGGGKLWRLKLTSQTWQGIVWNHDLLVVTPTAALKGRVFLYNDGGSANDDRIAWAKTCAEKIQAPVAMLLGIPNQPLLGGKKEDDLIAETFVRYQQTGDASWPLLFPMVKSVVRAMDAVQALAKQEEPAEGVTGFIVSGASKRGWTTWLTAASDSRVTAIAPMVIDVLNMPAQLRHQKESFGATSEEISPYTKRGMTPGAEDERSKALWRMVDPWSYRARFNLPKLIVLGNNDPYWSTDALNLYWSDLGGEKYISYSPNAGHDLIEKNVQGTGENRDRALNNVAAFVRHQLTGTPMPKISWDWSDGRTGSKLVVKTDPQPAEARLWWAQADTRDFRQARWQSRPLEVKAGEPIKAEVPAPAKGYIACYADLGYQVDGIPQWLCTQLQIIGAAKP